MTRRTSVLLFTSLLAAAASGHAPASAPTDEADRAPFNLRVLTRQAVAAPVEEARECVAGSPTGDYRMVVRPDGSEQGRDWSIIELEDPETGERTDAIRVYRLSGPCWAPDGSYFVFGEGGIVKGAAPGRRPIVLWQDTDSPRGGIYPAKSYNFRWGTAMRSLSFLTVNDPGLDEPSARIVTLRVK